LFQSQSYVGRVCHLQLLLALASIVILESESCGTHDHISLSQIQASSNLEGQVHVFISPSNRVAQLYPEALGSLFVTPPMTCGSLCVPFALIIWAQHGPCKKHPFQQFFHFCMYIWCHRSVFTEPLPISGRLFFVHNAISKVTIYYLPAIAVGSEYLYISSVTTLKHNTIYMSLN
jgi:hypothetical protein